MNDPVKVLMEMTDETVSAKYIAPILKMNPSVIVKYAKDGTWDADRLGKYVISGGHVKFFRKDFLQKCGFMEPEKEERTTEQLILEQMIALNEGATMICQMMTLMMEPYQLDALNELIDKKTAGAATPTD
jgi:hypothetical protein